MQEEQHIYHYRSDSPFVKDFTLVGVVKTNTVEYTDSIGVVTSTTDYEVHVGFAISKEDNYNKKLGVKKATARANKNPVAVLKGGEKNTLKSFLTFANSFIPRQAIISKVIVDVQFVK